MRPAVLGAVVAVIFRQQLLPAAVDADLARPTEIERRRLAGERIAAVEDQRADQEIVDRLNLKGFKHKRNAATHGRPAYTRQLRREEPDTQRVRPSCGIAPPEKRGRAHHLSLMEGGFFHGTNQHTVDLYNNNTNIQGYAPIRYAVHVFCEGCVAHAAGPHRRDRFRAYPRS
jgi:hypothetical protein